jgi:predicted kinase
MERKKSSGKKEEKDKSEGPYFIILCGLPGSGKSMFSKQLEEKGWIRISQDDLGSSDECKNLMEKSLKKGKSCILDRCNAHAKERKMFLNIAKQFTTNFESIYFNISPEECIRRIEIRKHHPTLAPEKAREVVEYFSKQIHPPETVSCCPEIDLTLASLKDSQKLSRYQQ